MYGIITESVEMKTRKYSHAVSGQIRRGGNGKGMVEIEKIPQSAGTLGFLN